MPVISTATCMSPCSRGSPWAVIAGCHAFLGTRAMASRTLLVTAYPTEYCTFRPRFASNPVSQSSSPWEAPAPSARINNFFRCAVGIWAIAAVSTATWSVAVFEPASPGRNISAMDSWVLAHHTPSG